MTYILTDKHGYKFPPMTEAELRDHASTLSKHLAFQKNIRSAPVEDVVHLLEQNGYSVKTKKV